MIGSDRSRLVALASFAGSSVLVKDSYASVECRVVRELGKVEGLAVFLVEALACYVDEDHPPVARLTGKTLRLGEIVD